MKNAVVNVIGMHPVQANEPVWLVEGEISKGFGEIDWGSITQPVPDKDPSYWQVPYDERDLGASGAGKRIVVFFFHYLDLDRPFESAYGQIAIPKPTPLPDRLRFIGYESP